MLLQVLEHFGKGFRSDADPRGQETRRRKEIFDARPMPMRQQPSAMRCEGRVELTATDRNDSMAHDEEVVALNAADSRAVGPTRPHTARAGVRKAAPPIWTIAMQGDRSLQSAIEAQRSFPVRVTSTMRSSASRFVILKSVSKPIFRSEFQARGQSPHR